MTYKMSLVLWYSLAAFQYLNVWKVMSVSLELLVTSAILARVYWKVL